MNNVIADSAPPELTLTAADIRRAAAENILTAEAAERLVEWGLNQKPSRQQPVPIEKPKGLNLVTVAYYFGAMLMISACAWFLGDKWDELGSRGILITTLIYMGIALGTGIYLRRRGFLIAGGLLITVAVSLVPLITYSIEDLAGVWPGTRPGPYKNYYPWIHGSWIVMELATIAAAAVALRYVKFSFLTAPMAFSFWFFSMDAAAWALNSESLGWNARCWVSIGVGLITMAIGYGLERSLGKKGAAQGEDFAFWCYLFGLMAFWGGMTSMESQSELGRAIYACISLGLIGVSVLLRRTTFLVFGAFGINVYVGHLAYDRFKDSFFFPFVLALVGLLTILLAVWFQRRMFRPTYTVRARQKALDGA